MWAIIFIVVFNRKNCYVNAECDLLARGEFLLVCRLQMQPVAIRRIIQLVGYRINWVQRIIRRTAGVSKTGTLEHATVIQWLLTSIRPRPPGPDESDPERSSLYGEVCENIVIKYS